MRPPRTSTWTERGLRFGLGAATIGVGVVAGIARNKWLAQHLATAGIGIVGQVTAMHTWLGIAAALGLGTAVTRAVGAANGADDAERVRRITWTALTVTGLVTGVIVAAGLAAAPLLAGLLLGDAGLAPVVRIAMIGVAGYALYSIVTGVFAGRSDVRAPLTLAIVGGAWGVALTFGLVPRAGHAGAVLAVSTMVLAGTLGALLVHRRDYASVFARPSGPRVDRAVLRELLGVGAAALVLALVDQGVLLGARAHYVQRHGVGANGLFQAALALSQQVAGPFYVYLANYSLGRMSGLSGVTEMREYTRRQWRPLMLLAALTFALAMVLAGPLLRLLYSERFDPARAMAAWMLLGEFGKVALQTWAVGSLPLSGTRLWLPLMLVFPVVLGLSYAALVAAGFGLAALPLAYLCAGLAGLLVTGIAMSAARITLPLRDLALLLAVLAALALLAQRIAGAS